MATETRRSQRLQQRNNGKEETKNGHAISQDKKNKDASQNGRHAERRESMTVSLSPAMVLIVMSSLLAAFGAGRMARPRIILKGALARGSSAMEAPSSRAMEAHLKAPESVLAPHIGLMQEETTKGKVVGPISIYSFQNFDKEICTREEEEQQETSNSSTESSSCSIYAAPPPIHEEMLVSSTGQHLVVDMENVEMELLNSDERLSQAIIDSAEECDMVLRSVHCHFLHPMGVSCIGLLGKGHIAFHTWPIEGVITLDFFAWSVEEPLLNFLHVIINRFGTPRDASVPTGVSWSQKRRGFHPDDDPTDFDNLVAEPGWLVKEQVFSVETSFQRIDIIRGIDMKISHDVNKFVFLNGQMQSNLFGEAAYHEALVHPAMFAHDKPERVAIIGGGEGATLREVLKHATVQDAIMIDIDAQMIDVSREYLPEWSDCTGFGSGNCFDEPRTRLYAEDALAWFIDRFYSSGDQEANSNGLDNVEPLDVIIMDALDPQDHAEFCETLYNNNVFIQALYNALSEEGILVMQLGESLEYGEAPEELTIHHHRSNIIRDLEEVGFESVHIYDEGHCLFSASWTYLVAFKDHASRQNWYANEAEIELAMQERSRVDDMEGLPFRHFDGANMVSYQVPPKVFETVYCRQQPTPKSCELLRGFDPFRPNVGLESLEVKTSERENAGRGVFTKVDIAKDVYIGLEQGVESVDFPPSTHSLIYDLEDHDEGVALAAFDYYISGYGFECDERGGTEAAVDSSILTFANHGCNGAYNIGWLPSGHVNTTEFTVDIAEMPEDHFRQDSSLYNPVLDRNRRHLNGGGDVSLRDIRAGEELLDNYLSMTSDISEWENDVMSLRAQCTGQGVGDVSKYEAEHGA